MRHRPALLQTLAATSWTATFTGAFTGFDDHPGFGELDARLWFCSLGASMLLSWAAIQRHLIGRASRAATAMTQAALSRPLYRDQTGPQPALVVPCEPRRKPAGPHATAR